MLTFRVEQGGLADESLPSGSKFTLGQRHGSSRQKRRLTPRSNSCGRSIPVHLPGRDMLRHELIAAQFVRGEPHSVCDLAQGFPERWSWVVEYSWIDADWLRKFSRWCS